MHEFAHAELFAKLFLLSSTPEQTRQRASQLRIIGRRNDPHGMGGEALRLASFLKRAAQHKERHKV